MSGLMSCLLSFLLSQANIDCLQFVVGALIVLVAAYIYGNPTPGSSKKALRPPPIRIDTYEKDIDGDNETSLSPPTNDFSIKLQIGRAHV